MFNISTSSKKKKIRKKCDSLLVYVFNGEKYTHSYVVLIYWMCIPTKPS